MPKLYLGSDLFDINFHDFSFFLLFIHYNTDKSNYLFFSFCAEEGTNKVLLAGNVPGQKQLSLLKSTKTHTGRETARPWMWLTTVESLVIWGPSCTTTLAPRGLRMTGRGPQDWMYLAGPRQTNKTNIGILAFFFANFLYFAFSYSSSILMTRSTDVCTYFFSCGVCLVCTLHIRLWEIHLQKCLPGFVLVAEVAGRKCPLGIFSVVLAQKVWFLSTGVTIEYHVCLPLHPK